MSGLAGNPNPEDDWRYKLPSDPIWFGSKDWESLLLQHLD